MATLVIGERSFEIAPYKLGALRKAAPIIAAINASFEAWEKKIGADGEPSPTEILEGMLESLQPLVEFMAIGLQRTDPSLTAEALDDMVGIGDAAALTTAFREIMSESGFAPKGEAKAPAQTTETAGASTIS